MGTLERIAHVPVQDVWEAETRILHRVGAARRPVAVQWLTTTACDLSCPHCRIDAGRRSDGELTTDEARRLLIDELVPLGRPTLVLSGGELLLRRDIPELVEYARRSGIEWSMHTHGKHVSRIESLLRRHPPGLAAISLDGPAPFHDRFRGRQGSFASALEAVRLLKECGCREVVIGTTVSRDNADLMADLFPIVARSGADSWGLHLLAPEGRGGECATLMPTREQMRRVAAFVRRRRSFFPIELCNEWGGAGPNDYLYRDAPFLCGAGRITCVVSATGEVLPCMTSDASESVGNVRSERLSLLWSRGFGKFRRKGEDPASDGEDCWLQTRHGSECHKLDARAWAAQPVAPSEGARRFLEVVP
jgi:radical SAM protein with 4Fe4S-binding SPASM domain